MSGQRNTCNVSRVGRYYSTRNAFDAAQCIKCSTRQLIMERLWGTETPAEFRPSLIAGNTVFEISSLVRLFSKLRNASILITCVPLLS